MAPGGYAWWYVDALSDNGEYGLTVIGFIGSVFSPYYARARQRSRALGHGMADANPLAHCALNVAIYSASKKRWAMTERGVADLTRTPRLLQIGPSAMSWERGTLVIRIDETTVPWPSRLRGVVRVTPACTYSTAYPLDVAARHHWWPIAPCARVDVNLPKPGMRWSGDGYLDANYGDRPLEADFTRWDWSRAAVSGERTAVLYDVAQRDGTATSLAYSFDTRGDVKPFRPPATCALPTSRWGVARGTRSAAGRPAQLLLTLEDAPFYTRSVLDTHLLGESTTAMHESLSLERFDSRWVRSLLPFRMPRRAS